MDQVPSFGVGETARRSTSALGLEVRRAIAFLSATLAALVTIGFVLVRGTGDTVAGALIFLFIFVGMPCLLFSIRGVIAAFGRSPSPRRRFSVLIHVCAAFGALIGAAIFAMARAADPASAAPQAWFIVIFPVIIYGLKLTIDILAALVHLLFKTKSPR